MSLKIVFLILVFMNLKVFVVQGCVACDQGSDDYYDYDYYDESGSGSGDDVYEYYDTIDCFEIFANFSEDSSVFLEEDAKLSEMEKAKESIIQKVMGNSSGKWIERDMAKCFEEVKNLKIQ